MNTNLRPFTCYFCNKLIERETERSHVSTCGAVLEPCPYKCGSYVARNIKMRHLQECVNRRNNTMPRLMKQKRVETDAPSSPTSSSSSSNMAYNGTSLPPSLNIPRDNFSPPLHSDNFNIPYKENVNVPPKDNLTVITKKFILMEQEFTQLQKNIDTIRSRQEQLQVRTATYENIHRQYEKLLYQSQMLLEWKRNVDVQLNSLNYEANQNAQNRTETEKKWSSIIDEKMKILQELNSNLNNQKDNFLKEQLYNRETQNDLQAEIKKFQAFYTQENATVCALWSDQGKQIESLKDNITSLSTSLDDQKLKHSTLVFDLRAISQISAENADKLEIQQRELKELKKNYLQLKLEVEMLEEANNSREHLTPGRMVWRINDFTMKMETAKSNNFLLKSPVFYSHPYGYKIRLVVYLNGIKKWKGRHMIAYLHVLKGDYDLMLPWPCNIDGNVIIRDLQDYANPKNIIKYVTAKRQHAEEDTEEPQESSSQYIFVPHTQILKSNYVKEDIVFIEIKINSRKYQEETSL